MGLGFQLFLLLILFIAWRAWNAYQKYLSNLPPVEPNRGFGHIDFSPPHYRSSYSDIFRTTYDTEHLDEGHDNGTKDVSE
jgi:hypothetical protein